MLTQLTKFDGTKMRRLRSREFHQIGGRAGRAGFDTEGMAIALAPEHEIENHKALLKAGDDPKKQRCVKKKQPPEGFVSWNKQTFEHLIEKPPEKLTPRMRITHSMVLSVVSRGGDAWANVHQLIADSAQTVDLPEDFALDQPLSPFLLAALDLLDPESDTYALDVISLVEATLENPAKVLRAQERKARDAAMAAMKADGVEYEERLERLAEVTYPKPLEELLDRAFELYCQGVPWARDYFAEHNEIRLDGDARSAAYLSIDESPEAEQHLWHVRQIFLGENADGDFRIEADVNLDATQEEGEVIFKNYRVGFVEDLAE